MMDPFPNARLGIQLAQQGRREDALSYLRIAVQSEPAHPELWLWLAHVTPRRDEYQHCVQQALVLAPNHATARQMFALLRNNTGSMPAIAQPNPSSGQSRPMTVDEQLLRSMKKQKQRKGQRRFLLIMMAFWLIFGLAALIGLVFQDELNATFSDDDAPSPPQLTITVAPQNTDTVDHFRMAVPESWLVADANNSAWQEQRQRLEANELLQVDWSTLEHDASQLNISLENNLLSTQISIVETDAGRILDSGGFPLRLELVRLNRQEPLLAQGVDCDNMRRFAEEQRISLAEAESVVENAIVEQNNDRCIFYIHYRGSSALSKQVEHIFVIYVPIAPQGMAEWHLTVSDTGLADYQASIDALLRTITAF